MPKNKNILRTILSLEQLNLKHITDLSLKIGLKARKTQKFDLKIRTEQEQFQAESAEKIRTAEPQQKFTGSYKKKV